MKKNFFITIAMAVLVPLMFSACKKTEPTRAAVSPEAHQQEMLRKSFDESKKAVVARVNGEPITMFTLLREMNEIAPRYQAKDGQISQQAHETIRKDALNNVIFLELATQEARKRGLKSAPEMLNNEIKKIKDGTGSPKAYQAYLDKNGLTEQELQKIIEQDALFEMIAVQEVDNKITITDTALQARYQKDKPGLKDSAHRTMTFEAAKPLLEQTVRTEMAEQKMREWQKELKKNARIEILEQQKK